MRVLVFDTETTGLPPHKSREVSVMDHVEWPHIVQFSYIIYNSSEENIDLIIDRVICIPDCVEITTENCAIHGITKEMTKKGCPIYPVLLEFMRYMSECDIVVAHNIEFDLNMVVVELVRLGLLQEIEYIHGAGKYYCTMQQSIDLCNIRVVSKYGNKEYVKFPSLSNLHEHFFGVVPLHLHNSVNDVLICLRCFYKMKFKNDICEKNAEIENLMKKLIP